MGRMQRTHDDIIIANERRSSLQVSGNICKGHASMWGSTTYTSNTRVFKHP